MRRTQRHRPCSLRRTSLAHPLANIKNRKMKNLFLIILLFSLAENVFSQNKYLTIGSYSVDVNSSILARNNLPSSSANPYNMESVFDDSGNLVFYIEDGVIYDKNGAASFSIISCPMGSDGVQIIPIPEDCDSYYVVSTDCNGTVAYVSVSVSPNNYQLTFTSSSTIQTRSNVFDYTKLAVSNLKPSNERYLYALNKGISRFVVSNSGITFANNLFPSSSTLYQIYGSFNNSEFEISVDGTKLVAERNDDIYIFDLSSSGNYQSHRIFNVPNTSRVRGFELVGNILFVSSGLPPYPLSNDGINYFDISQSSPIYNHIPSSLNYQFSYIELINNGNLLVRSNNNLAQINPTTITLTPSISLNSSLNIHPLPNQIDGELIQHKNSSSKAIASFINFDRVESLNSLYGPIDVYVLCLSDKLLVDGSASSCEDGYFVGLSEFDLMTWTDIGNPNPLFSDWISATGQAPNNIKIIDYLPQGYQLRPNKIYKFRLAVGPQWDATDIWFKIDCCSSGGVISDEGKLDERQKLENNKHD